MKKLVVAAAVLCASIAQADSATCYPGGDYSITYGVIAEPQIIDGAITWQTDTDVRLTATTDCLVSWTPAIEEVKTSAPGLYVECRAYGYIAIRSDATSLMVDSGAISWIDTSSGVHYYSTLPCMIYTLGE